MHVLVIDDEPDLIELCRMTLEADGHRVSVALGGDEGLASVWSDPPDVVLLDFMMPGVDGLTVLERLRRDLDPHGQVPVVMLSAKGRAEDALRGLAAGATAYVVKPFVIEDLERLLRTVAGETPDQRDLRRTRALASLTTERGVAS